MNTPQPPAHMEILMSVKKRWLDLIISGAKMIEVRKSAPVEPRTFLTGWNEVVVWLYESGPRGSHRIVATARLYALRKYDEFLTANEWWEQFGRYAEVDWLQLTAYSKFHPVWLWFFRIVRKLKEPITLEGRPPMSWRYLKDDEMDRLHELVNKQNEKETNMNNNAYGDCTAERAKAVLRPDVDATNPSEGTVTCGFAALEDTDRNRYALQDAKETPTDCDYPDVEEEE